MELKKDSKLKGGSSIKMHASNHVIHCYRKQGPAVYGYKWKDQELVIDEEEAPIRKLMYELFLQSNRKKVTATELNNRGYRTRNGSLFSHTTINRLLNDTTAKGIYKINGNAKDMYIYSKREHSLGEFDFAQCPAIISETIWNKCQMILQPSTSLKKPGRQCIYLLAGLLYCMCGKKMYVYHKNKYPAFRCKRCRVKIQVDDIDTIFHEQLKSFYIFEQELIEHEQKPDWGVIESNALLKSTMVMLEKVQKEIGSLNFVVSKNDLNKSAYAETFFSLEQQQKQLQQQIDMLSQASQAQYPVKKKMSEVSRTSLYDTWLKASFEVKRRIIETITNNIIVFKNTIDINFRKELTSSFSINVGKSERV